MHKLTGKQCRMARALLKWNVYDLASHVSGISPKRIESFERGTVHSADWENTEMVTAFRKEGVQFNDEMDVTLAAGKKKGISHNSGGSGQGAVIKLDGDMDIISDSTADAIPLIPDHLRDVEEEKKKK